MQSTFCISEGLWKDTLLPSETPYGPLPFEHSLAHCMLSLGTEKEIAETQPSKVFGALGGRWDQRK